MIDKELQPYLAKIDELEASVTELEKVVILLDNYTLKLGNNFFSLKHTHTHSLGLILSHFSTSSSLFSDMFLLFFTEEKFRILKQTGKYPFKKETQSVLTNM